MLRRAALRPLATRAGRAARFCLRTHTWVRSIPGQRVQLGFTDRALEDIGDVTEVVPMASVGDAVRPNQALLQVLWEAMRISDGDELYHTTWANVEGDARLLAPCSGTVSAINNDSDGGRLDAADWLVELAVLDETPLWAQLVDQEHYLRECGVGKFGEADDSLRYTSYG